MIIVIIGKLNPSFAYEEWVSKLQTNLEVENVTQINITIGNGLLNQYVRKYAQSHNLTVKDFSPDFITYGDEAKRRRNVALVENSDLIVGFLPEGSSEESRIFRPGISRKKNAVAIYCQNNQAANRRIVRNVITRWPSNEVETVCQDELITVEDEAELVRIIQQGEEDVDAAKEKLMFASHRFLRTVAQKYVTPYFSL